MLDDPPLIPHSWFEELDISQLVMFLPENINEIGVPTVGLGWSCYAISKKPRSLTPNGIHKISGHCFHGNPIHVGSSMPAAISMVINHELEKILISCPKMAVDQVK